MQPSSVSYDMTDNAFVSRMQNNLFAFSGAKSFAQMQEMRDAVLENGKVVPWTRYREKAFEINSLYNENYLEAERQNVITSATMGSKWQEIERTKHLYPYLQYLTEGDSRVRPEHAALSGITLPVENAFWEQYYPPNGWRCRCSVRRISQRSVDNGQVKLSDSNNANRAGGTNIKNKFFRKNPGKSGIIFKDSHPYNAQMPTKQLKAVDNYGMKNMDQVYADPNRLAVRKGRINNEMDYETFWNRMATNNASKVEGNNFELKNDTLGVSMLFTEELKEKTLRKGRFRYADDLERIAKDPDEIWSNYYDSKKYRPGEFEYTFIKYYQDNPVIMAVKHDGTVKTFYQLKNPDSAGNQRRGLLLHKK